LSLPTPIREEGVACLHVGWSERSTTFRLWDSKKARRVFRVGKSERSTTFRLWDSKKARRVFQVGWSERSTTFRLWDSKKARRVFCVGKSERSTTFRLWDSGSGFGRSLVASVKDPQPEPVGGFREWGWAFGLVGWRERSPTCPVGDSRDASAVRLCRLE
jgi:hypothetical protein